MVVVGTCVSSRWSLACATHLHPLHYTYNPAGVQAGGSGDASSALKQSVDLAVGISGAEGY